MMNDHCAVRKRARPLRAALGFASLEPREPELRLQHRWLDSWSGIGHIVTGMAGQDYDLELRRYDEHRMAGHLLSGRLRALADLTRQERMGAESVGGGTAGSMDGAHSTGENNPTLCSE